MRFALVLSILVAGCSEESPAASSGPCGARVDCPSERAPRLADQCTTAIAASTCGEQFRLYYECLQRNQVCNGLGRYDDKAMDARCVDLATAWQGCAGIGDAAPIDSGHSDTFVPEDTAPEDTSVADTTTAD